MTFGPTHVNPYADRTSVAPNRVPYQPYQHDSEPDSYYREQPLRISRKLPAASVRLQDPRLRCERNLGWSIDWAVAFIVDRLDKKNSPDVADVLKSIRIKALDLENEGLSKEIPYCVFNKLDETLFAGHLKNAVFLDIRSLGGEVSGATHSQGWGLDPKVKRISIVLNGNILQHARSRDIIATLIHHMIHAYFLIACGPQREQEVGYGRLCHGFQFGKIMMTIKQLSSVRGRPLSALDFGHSLAKSRYFYDEHHYQRRKPYHRRRGKEKWYCSHCYSDLDPISEKEIDKWYNAACKPLFHLPELVRSSTVSIYNDRRCALEEVPRAETVPSAESSEFLFHDKPFLVPASHIARFFSIHRVFERERSRYLEVHEDVDKETFERFLELLHTGTYGPEAKHIHAMGRKGPPVIKSSTGSEPYLLTDIRIFKMGCLMGFDELKGIALDRMYRHSITHEDPVSLLRAIYNGNEPDGDLKVWVRKFLTRTPTAADVDYLGIPSSHPMTEPSNLAKLEADMLGYKARFYDLLQESSALKYEIGEARRELFATGMYASPGMFGAISMGVPRSISPPMRLGLGMPGVGAAARGAMMNLPWIAPAPPATHEELAADAYLGRGFGYEGFEGERWMYE